MRGGTSQGLALVIGQEQGRGKTGLFAPLIAHGGPAVFSRRVAAVELHARTIQPVLVPTQHVQPHRFPRPVFAPCVEPGVHALPGQGRAGKKLFNRQIPPMATGFELVKQGLD